MKQYRQVAIAITCLVFLLNGSACQSPSEIQRETITPSAKATPLLRSDFGDMPDSLLPQPFLWPVEIVQHDKVINVHDGEVSLDRQPFTIRVTLFVPRAVHLNVLDDDSNFKAIQPGLHTDCPIPFCIGGGVAEDDYNQLPSRLYVGKIGYHLLTLDTQGENWYRWNRATETREGIVFERDVFFLNDTPIEEYKSARLYLVFFVDYHNYEVIDDDELKKVVLHFE